MANPTEQADRLIWIDLEMTGLDPAHERIIEVARWSPTATST